MGSEIVALSNSRIEDDDLRQQGVIIVLKRAESGISPHDPFNCAVNYKMGIYDRHLIALDLLKVQVGA